MMSNIINHYSNKLGKICLITFFCLTLVSACKPRLPAPTLVPQPTLVEEQDLQTPIAILFVHAVEKEDGTWTFHVTLEHEDTGWEDYVDGWDVMLQDGTVLKTDPESPFTRLILHPHVDEQPFTRSQSDIVIPPGGNIVIVRAHELVEGYSSNDVIIDLSTTNGEYYQVDRAVKLGSFEKPEPTPNLSPGLSESIWPGNMGLTYPNSDGNRYLKGSISLPQITPLDVPLAGKPIWVVGLSTGSGHITWMVMLENGSVQSFQTHGMIYEELGGDFYFPDLSPLAISKADEEIQLLNMLFEDSAALSHPIHISRSGYAYTDRSGRLILVSSNAQAALPVNALPDTRLLVDEEGSILLLTDPTSSYDHGVLGDAVEAQSITYVSSAQNNTIIEKISLPEGQVIEGIAPIWADVTGDGVREIIVTQSTFGQGARLVIYNQNGEMIAESNPIGKSYRWRHQIAVAPFGPDGELELVDVLTPHIGGVVEFFQLKEGKLMVVAQLSGFSSHKIGSRNLDMSFAGDVDADGQVELLIPNQDFTSLNAIQRTAAGAQLDWEIPLDGKLTSNVATSPIDAQNFAIAVGLDQGILRIWQP